MHPRDVVPPLGITLDILAELDAMAGHEVTVIEPGDVPTDPDGIPLAVGPNTSSTATLAGAIFTLAELQRLGGNPEDYPNLQFIDIGGTRP